MPGLALNDNVHDLTRRHVRREGHMKGQWEEALLDQLDAAITQIGTNGGKSSGESSLPVSIKAIDTQRSVTRTIKDHEHDRGGNPQRPIRDILVSWSEDADAGQYLEHVTADLITEIRGSVEPRVKPIPLDHACPDPSCGKRRVKELDEAGSWVQRPALFVQCRDTEGKGLAISEWAAHCAACGREWRGANDMAWLGRMVNEMSPQ